jgi:hypothetical protein
MVTVKQARAKNRLYPVILLDIELLNGGGTIYLSDKNILVGSTQYQKHILNATDISDAVKRDTSQGDNPAVLIQFINKAFRAYSHLSLIEDAFPLAGGKVTIKEVYLDDNNDQSDLATLFVGEFEEIRNETRQVFEITAMSIKTANSIRNLGRV